MDAIAALLALTLMEIVLGIDNIIFITILTDRLPEAQQPLARRLGLLLAMLTRVVLLSAIKWVLGLTGTVFTLGVIGLSQDWIKQTNPQHWEDIYNVSWRDMILVGGGLFLIGKSVLEIHRQFEGANDDHVVTKTSGFTAVLIQIAILDIVFSLDSVITAIGMAENLSVMITAVVISIIVMLLFAERISRFVSRHPTLKVLALSFLILIGVMLVAEAIGTEVNKAYIYFAMSFSLVVEMINIQLRRRGVES
ncbi:MAG: TerC family protein [Fuerstiella sp.]|nr:TerC family protein [Fuerstiella sp.]